VYDRLVSSFGSDLRFLLLIADTPGIGSPAPSTVHQYWEYLSDVIIRVDYTYGDEGYFTRQLEIVKTRFQPHVLGKQVVKIFPYETPNVAENLDVDPEGARPHLREGGLFLFPSEHYILSKILRRHGHTPEAPSSASHLTRRSPLRPSRKWSHAPCGSRTAARASRGR
jgi:hypothetical protein